MGLAVASTEAYELMQIESELVKENGLCSIVALSSLGRLARIHSPSDTDGLADWRVVDYEETGDNL